jgi:hypothetical protein
MRIHRIYLKYSQFSDDFFIKLFYFIAYQNIPLYFTCSIKCKYAKNDFLRNISHLSMKEGSSVFLFFVLFCLVCWDLWSYNASCHNIDIIKKPLMSKGVMSWFNSISTYNGEVIEYWIIFPLKIHLNQN